MGYKCINCNKSQRTKQKNIEHKKNSQCKFYYDLLNKVDQLESENTELKTNSSINLENKIEKLKKENKRLLELTKHLENKNIKYETVYLLQEREFIKTKENIYKIGRTKKTMLERLRGYPKGSNVIYQNLFKCCDKIENKLKIVLNLSFKQRIDIGTEYFEGDLINIINTINKVTFPYLLNNTVQYEQEQFKSLKQFELKSKKMKLLLKLKCECKVIKFDGSPIRCYIGVKIND
jgi:hypothetical protein